MGTGHTARTFSGGWAAVYADRVTMWRCSRSKVNGACGVATRATTTGAAGPLEVRYSDFVAGRPATIRPRLDDDTVSGQRKANTDLTIRLSQVEVNQPVDPAAFAVDIPADAVPITLDELRQAGPLGR